MTRREERENIYRILFRDAFHKSAEMGEQLDLAIEGIAASPISDEEQAYIHGDGNLTEEEEQRIRPRLGEILDHKEEIDSAIASASEGWNFERIGKAELAILRLAVYEMRYDDDIPVKVAINEAVELSKVYCNEDARAFVNGVLGKISGSGK